MVRRPFLAKQYTGMQTTMANPVFTKDFGVHTIDVCMPKCLIRYKLS